MTRRNLLRVIAAGGGTASVPVRGQHTAKPNIIGYREYAKCLPDSIRMLASQAYDRRTAQIRKLTSATAIHERQRWVRETFWKIAGGMPHRTSLNTRTTGAFEREKYRVEKLVYESRPDEWISANLYVPKNGAAPFPGVLFHMGHTSNGKAGDTYQRCCQGLVQLGFVVLAFDPMGQGERIDYPGPDGSSRLLSPDHEPTKAGMQMLLIGETATSMQTWDAVRSLDVLASHPLVDPKRLASTGQSGAATITMMLAAVDDRLAFAAVSSGNTENFACANFLPLGSTDDAEQNLVGSGPLGFDRRDLLWPIAPKPLLILTSAKDFFGTYSPNYEENGLEEYGRLEAAYRFLQKPDHLQRFESPLPHGLSYVLRLEIYRWLTRWLQDGRKIDQEPPVAPEPDRNLWGDCIGKRSSRFGKQDAISIIARDSPQRKNTIQAGRFAESAPDGADAEPSALTRTQPGAVARLRHSRGGNSYHGMRLGASLDIRAKATRGAPVDSRRSEGPEFGVGSVVSTSDWRRPGPRCARRTCEALAICGRNTALVHLDTRVRARTKRIMLGHR